MSATTSMRRALRPIAGGIAAGLVAVHFAGAAPQGAGAKTPASTKAAPPAAANAAGAAGQVRGSAGGVLQREVYAYSPAGRRDPFVSLAQTSDLRPLITDLTLVGVLADPRGGRSVAVLRDKSNQAMQYRVTVGSTLGRLRVTRITSREVTFTVEEFGRNRQETLGYAADSTRMRTP